MPCPSPNVSQRFKPWYICLIWPWAGLWACTYDGEQTLREMMQKKQYIEAMALCQQLEQQRPHATRWHPMRQAILARMNQHIFHEPSLATAQEIDAFLGFIPTQDRALYHSVLQKAYALFYEQRQWTLALHYLHQRDVFLHFPSDLGKQRVKLICQRIEPHQERELLLQKVQQEHGQDGTLAQAIKQYCQPASSLAKAMTPPPAQKPTP